MHQPGIHHYIKLKLILVPIVKLNFYDMNTAWLYLRTDYNIYIWRVSNEKNRL